jgi:hypothetical protein
LRALKVGHEYFDAASRNPLADSAYRHREQFGSAVLTIVTVHARDHGVAQTERRTCFGYTPRLIVIGLERSALLDGTESAPPGAHVP